MRGRIRSIKPEVHTDELLWDLEEQTRMPIFRAFTGLWNYSDREGLIEWRPRALKAVILPYWAGDFGAVMDALAGAGFLLRYEVDGRTYGKVRTFKRHQVINNREEQSALPPPPEGRPPTRPQPPPPRVDDASGTREARDEHAGTDAGRDAGQGEGKGREGIGNGTEHLRTCVRVREVPPSAEETQRRFRALYLERFSSEPYMGGNAVHTFHDRLLGTARARGADPLALLAEAFERWAADPLDKIAQNAPYASFAGRFGSLLEAQSGHGVSEQEQLQTAQIEAMQRKDMARYRELVAEERRRFPSPKGGADANPAR